MKIHTANFVLRSDLFGNNDASFELWEEYASNHATWGQANHTLIDVETFVKITQEAIESLLPDRDLNPEDTKDFKCFERIIGELENLPPDTYIDLEN